ncbi:hypothetical protein [Thalassolituus sp.]|uniref:hypothetical protein n=1 Tax=Thalassolituus sp. TaxID=2030822 RepID=UPI003518BE8E
MEDEKEFDLSEGQRISLLERTVSFNRKIVILLVVLSVVGLSALSTLGIVSLLEEDVDYATAAELQLVKKENEALRIQIAAFEKSLVQYRKIMDTSQASGFKEILLDQERSYQTHLSALRQGMRDLAKMMPGSRTWLDMYDEQMNMALEESRQRVQDLAAIQTSELRNKSAPAKP